MKSYSSKEILKLLYNDGWVEVRCRGDHTAKTSHKERSIVRKEVHLNMKDKFVFPAIFTIDTDGISVEFPDLPGCLSCGDTEDEALYMAKDALELHLFGMEEDGELIPESSSVSTLKLEKNQFVALIEVWMPPIRDEMAQKSIKKTLTIPKWLNDLAEERKVNFSHVLQNALIVYLGLDKNKHKLSFRSLLPRNRQSARRRNNLIKGRLRPVFYSNPI